MPRKNPWTCHGLHNHRKHRFLTHCSHSWILCCRRRPSRSRHAPSDSPPPHCASIAPPVGTCSRPRSARATSGRECKAILPLACDRCRLWHGRALGPGGGGVRHTSPPRCIHEDNARGAARCRARPSPARTPGPRRPIPARARTRAPPGPVCRAGISATWNHSPPVPEPSPAPAHSRVASQAPEPSRVHLSPTARRSRRRTAVAPEHDPSLPTAPGARAESSRASSLWRYCTITLANGAVVSWDRTQHRPDHRIWNQPVRPLLRLLDCSVRISPATFGYILFAKCVRPVRVRCR